MGVTTLPSVSGPGSGLASGPRLGLGPGFAQEQGLVSSEKSHRALHMSEAVGLSDGLERTTDRNR